MVKNSAATAPAETLGLRQRGKLMRRERIIDAARALFREKGFEAASTREIAQRADVGTGTLFDYAPDKRALLMMVFYEDLDRLTEEAFETLPAGAPLTERLMHMFAPRLAVWAADLALSRYAARETFARFAPVPGNVPGTPRRSPLHVKIASIVEAASANGEVDASVATEDIVRLVIGIYLVESREWIQDEDANLATAVDRLRRLLTVALCGVRRGSRTNA